VWFSIIVGDGPKLLLAFDDSNGQFGDCSQAGGGRLPTDVAGIDTGPITTVVLTTLRPHGYDRQDNRHTGYTAYYGPYQRPHGCRRRQPFNRYKDMAAKTGRTADLLNLNFYLVSLLTQMKTNIRRAARTWRPCRYWQIQKPGLNNFIPSPN